MYSAPPSDFGVICDIRSYAWLDTSRQLLNLIKSSVQSGHYKLLWDKHQRPLGYIVWAQVCRETYLRLHRRGTYPQYTYEWSEGKITLVLDVLINDVDRKNAMRQIRQLINSKRLIAYRYKERTKIFKRKNRYFRKIEIGTDFFEDPSN